MTIGGGVDVQVIFHIIEIWFICMSTGSARVRLASWQLPPSWSIRRDS